MPEIFLTCKDYFPGVRAVFRHVESLGLGKFIGDISNPAAMNDINQSDLNEDDLVIFGAWDQTYALPMRRLKCEKGLLFTSSPGQMSLSPGACEIDMLAQLLRWRKEGKLDHLFILSRELFEYLKECTSIPITYFPAPFDFSLYEKHRFNNFEAKTRSIGLFIPQNSEARKNYYNQKLAVDMVLKQYPDVQIRTNALQWLPEEQYYSMLGSVMVNLQVTHTEAFDYQAAEAIACGTITVTSPCVRENIGLDDPFTVRNPDSPIEIKRRVMDVLELEEEEYMSHSRAQMNALKATAERNNTLLNLLLSHGIR